jgi:hypothetical protein
MSFRVGSDLRIDTTILRDGAAPGADPVASANLVGFDPEGLAVSWALTIDDGAAGTAHYSLGRASNLMAGTFSLWYEATFSGGAVVIGDPEPLTILAKGA